MELFETIALLVAVGLVSAIVGGLVSSFIVVYRLSPHFRREVKRFQHNWSMRIIRRIEAVIRQYEKIALVGYAITFGSMALFIFWFSTVLPNSPIPLKMPSSLILALVSIVGMLFGSSLMITGSSIGIIRRAQARKWR